MSEHIISSLIKVLELLNLGEQLPTLQELKRDLTLMLAFLRDFSGNRNYRRLILEVREMAYDVGVIFGTFIFTRKEELESICLEDFLGEIESVRSRSREVNQLELQYPVEEAEDIGRQHELAHRDDEEDVVGLENHVEMLIHYLHLSGKFYMFILVGMGGIGKTTLTRHVYNHAAVVDRFDCRGWACASSECNSEEVLRVLIRQVAVDLREEEEELMKDMGVESLQQMLHQHLMDKKYFIVLDNVWDDTTVNHVLHALPQQNNSSRMLLTSRSTKNILRESQYVFTMTHLDSDGSWQLFLKLVFTTDHKCPNHLEKIGKKIVENCNGLPYAIKEVGRQLATTSQSESAWEEFLESMDFRETIATLELSYNRLSPTQKSCFVHMSFFKEGTTISAKRFIHIWNAAVMVLQHIEGKNLEDTARSYVDDLCDQSMIVADFYTIENLNKLFHLDGFLHKMCITRAEEEIGLEILGNEQQHRQCGKPRHRVVYCKREKFNYSTSQDKHLLSLFFYGGCNFDASPSHWESFEQLRILDFEGFGLKSLGESDHGLDRLRYLGLRDNYLKKLPQTLGRLKNLEVLDIAVNFKIEVPDIIWEMDSLRHLYMSDIVCPIPLKIDSLKFLLTLTYISINNWAYEPSNLEQMTSLRKLGIEELDEKSDVSKLFASLSKLTDLKCLILRGFRYRRMPPLDDLSNLHGLTRLKVDGRLTRLPKFPPQIKYLSLVNSYLDVDPMPELEKLPELYYLLLQNAYAGREMVFSQCGLKLEVLALRQLWHLRNLKIENPSRHRLRQVEVCSCPYLNDIPKEMTSFGPWNLQWLWVVTSKKIAKVMRQSDITSETLVHIEPFGQSMLAS